MSDMVDPLIEAVIGKLPSAGSTWSDEQRAAWLRMMENAVDVVFGGSGGSMRPTKTAVPVAPQPSRPAPRSPAKQTPKKKPAPKRAAAKPKPPLPVALPDFFIDRDGIAMNAQRARIMPDQIEGGLIVDLRGESGDLGRIIWADGSKGIPSGLSLDIQAG